jgi:hypothetical protein
MKREESEVPGHNNVYSIRDLPILQCRDKVLDLV